MSEVSIQPAIFFDRDGVINVQFVDDYVKTWEEFEFLPGVFTVLPAVHAAGYKAVVITNQRGISRGFMGEEHLREIHARMQEEVLRRTGHQFDAIYYCPHARDGGCHCRKPLPGMIEDAARDLSIDLPHSWMIGDSDSDIEAGLAAGCRTVFVGPSEIKTRSEFVAANLEEAWEQIGSVTVR